MPHYDYKCASCGNIFEEFQSMCDAPLQTCSQCGGSLKRLIGGGAGVLYKGSGFYVTDYKKTESPKSDNSSAS